MDSYYLQGYYLLLLCIYYTYIYYYYVSTIQFSLNIFTFLHSPRLVSKGRCKDICIKALEVADSLKVETSWEIWRHYYFFFFLPRDIWLYSRVVNSFSHPPCKMIHLINNLFVKDRWVGATPIQSPKQNSGVSPL